MMTHPRLVMLQGEPEVIEYARELFKRVSWKQGGGRQQVSYDTQFQIGDYYVRRGDF